MMKVGNTDDGRVDRIGALVAQVVQKALASGLTWDEAIIAFGIASKAIAVRASTQGIGTPEACVAHAQGRLQYGMEHSADLLKAYLD